MRHAGNLPLKNQREIDRFAVAKMFGWEVSEINQAAQAFKALHRRQPESSITFEAYLQKMKESALRPALVGKRTGQYHLARPFDSGAYREGNCRFILGQDNIKERKEGYQCKPEFRKLCSELAKARTPKLCNKCGELFSPGMFARWHGDKCKR